MPRLHRACPGGATTGKLRNVSRRFTPPPPGLPLTIAHKIGWGPCLLTQQARTMEAVRKFTLLEFRDERCFHLFGACRLGC